MVEAELAFSVDEDPMDEKPAPDTEGNVGVGVFVCKVDGAILGVVLKVGAKGSLLSGPRKLYLL